MHSLTRHRRRHVRTRPGRDHCRTLHDSGPGTVLAGSKDAIDLPTSTGTAATRRPSVSRGLARLAILAILAFSLWVSVDALSAPPAMPPSPLPPGGSLWMPEIAPEGTVLIVVGIAEQRAWVYRNGVRIGVTAVSTGKPGHETPAGVFTILEKRREHYSNLYDNAPMPFMQRLTWDGVALHAGLVPGYPASHGCVRLPREFAEQLFGITERGMTVVIAETFAAPAIVSPGLFSPQVAPATETAAAWPAATRAWGWHPERAPDGPLTLVLSSRDREIVVLRNAVEIGRAAVDIDAAAIPGSRAYLLLAGSGSGASPLLPDRPALRWLDVPLDANVAAPGDDLRQLVADGRLRVPPDFARLVYDALSPGTTLVVTDDPLEPTATADLPVLQADAPPFPVDEPAAAPPSTPDP